MNKRRDRFYIGIALCMVFVVAVFAVLYVLGENRRNKAVEELRAKAAINTRSLAKSKPVVARPTKSKPRKASDLVERETPKSSEDTVGAGKSLEEKLTAARENDPIWNEIVQRKWYKGWTQEELERGVRYLEDNRELFQEVRRLANSDSPLYVVDFEDNYSRFYAYYYSCQNWLNFTAFIAASQDDFEGAAEDYITILNLADKLKETPRGNAQLIHMKISSYCCENINENIGGENLSYDTLRRLIRISSYDASERDIFANAMATDGALSLDAFDQARNHEYRYEIDIEPKFIDEAVLTLYGTWLGRPLLNIDEDVYASTMNRMSHALTLPYYQAKPTIDRVNTEIENLPSERIVSRMALQDDNGIISDSADIQAQHEAMLGLMQLGLTIEHYYGQHGVYPDSLEEIAPMLDGPLPIDPYTGQSYVYELQEDDFTLYSARGSVVENPRRIAEILDERNNIVWRHTEE